MSDLLASKGDPNTVFPPRIHVLVAPKAELALIIRRGPSKRVCTLSWNLADNSLTMGQWLKGRIFERRSDLSPDGKHFIYFALNGKWEEESRGSWTAVSYAPYLKAVGFWPKGDAWFGGGLFIDKSQFWLNGYDMHQETRFPPHLKRVDSWPDYEYFGGECPGVYYLRLIRDGWQMGETIDMKTSIGETTTWEKPLPNGWLLRKFTHGTLKHPPGRGCYYDEHQLVNTRTGEEVDGNAWEWADFVGKRLLWAQDGKIFARSLKNRTFDEAQQLFDLNDMAFEPIAAPY